ncbi:UNVERIFIED_CONTAM: hypothetical protein K2H54_062045 [Gekko kuhli]
MATGHRNAAIWGPQTEPRMKMEMQGLMDSECGKDAGKGSHVIHPGSMEESWEGAIPEHIKREPEAGPHEHWEAQWQQFLKTVQTPQSGQGDTQLPGLTPRDDSPGEEVSDTGVPLPGEKETRLLPSIGGETEHPVNSFLVKEQVDSQKVKEETQAEGDANWDSERRCFRQFCYQEAEGPREVSWQLKEEGEDFPEAEGAPLESCEWPLFREIKQEEDGATTMLGDERAFWKEKHKFALWKPSLSITELVRIHPIKANSGHRRKVVVEQTDASDFGLRLVSALDPGVKMEEQDLTGPEPGKDADRGPHITQSGSMKEFVDVVASSRMEQESEIGLHERWEAQWQQFLKTVQSPQPRQGDTKPTGLVPRDDSPQEGISRIRPQPPKERVAQLLGREAQPSGRNLSAKTDTVDKTVKEEKLDVEITRQHFRQFGYREASGPREVPPLGISEEAASAPPEAERPAPDAWQTLAFREVKEEGEEDASSVAGDVSSCEKEKNQSENCERLQPCGMLPGKYDLNPSRGSENWQEPITLCPRPRFAHGADEMPAKG